MGSQITGQHQQVVRLLLNDGSPAMYFEGLQDLSELVRGWIRERGVGAGSGFHSVGRNLCRRCREEDRADT